MGRTASGIGAWIVLCVVICLGPCLVLCLAGCGARTAPEEGEPPPPSPDGGRMVDAGPTVPETCDGLDDDGDGEVDEGCACGFSEVRACVGELPGPGMELCAPGTERCSNGEWGECRDAVHCHETEEIFVYSDAVDLLLVVDQSESMRPHFDAVHDSVTALAAAIAASERDYALILLGSRSGEHGLCIGPPLGGLACDDSERFHQVDVEVGSRDALDLVLEHRDAIEGVARPHSQRSILVVTDDDAWRIDLYESVGAMPGWDAYYLDAVIGTWDSRCDIARRGVVYDHIARLTGGRTHDICAADLEPTFHRIATDVLRRPRRFPLAAEPWDHPRVLIGDPPVALPEDAWWWDERRNAVVIERGPALGPGVPLVVRYRVAG